MHDVAGEIACAEGCAETISANVLKAAFTVLFHRFQAIFDGIKVVANLVTRVKIRGVLVRHCNFLGMRGCVIRR